MLLSRVADDLYWMGRYLERAENCSRQITVTHDFSHEIAGLDKRRARREWAFLAQCYSSSGARTPPSDERSDLALWHANYYLVDAENPVSVASSVSFARDCARATSEWLTREVVTNLNETHARLRRLGRSPMRDRGRAFEEVDRTHRQILLTLGAVENTMTRNQGWCHHKLGEAMERARRTLVVLGARLPTLRNVGDDSSSPLQLAGWRSLLAHLSSLENYRQVFGPRFQRGTVAQFLLFHPSAPRSVYSCVRRMSGYLAQLPQGGPGVASAAREVGRLSAQLEFDQEELLAEPSLDPFIQATLAALTRVHGSLTSWDGEA